MQICSLDDLHDSPTIHDDNSVAKRRHQYQAEKSESGGGENDSGHIQRYPDNKRGNSQRHYMAGNDSYWSCALESNGLDKICISDGNPNHYGINDTAEITGYRADDNSHRRSDDGYQHNNI